MLREEKNLFNGTYVYYHIGLKGEITLRQIKPSNQLTTLAS